MRYERYMRYMRYMRYARYMRYMRYMRYARRLLRTGGQGRLEDERFTTGPVNAGDGVAAGREKRRRQHRRFGKDYQRSRSIVLHDATGRDLVRRVRAEQAPCRIIDFKLDELDTPRGNHRRIVHGAGRAGAEDQIDSPAGLRARQDGILKRRQHSGIRDGLERRELRRLRRELRRCRRHRTVAAGGKGHGRCDCENSQ